MIKNIIFDFDGVICESVKIKTEAFYEMYLPYGETIAQKVKEHHLKNGGMSRFEKFKWYEEQFLSKNIDDAKLNELSTTFSSLVKIKVIEAPFVKGALEFLEANSRNYQCFIVSATPMDEMKEIADAKKISSYFSGIYGSPKNKIDWCQEIIKTFDLDIKKTLFIGDAKSDYIAASENKLYFLLRLTSDNQALCERYNLQAIPDLIGLPDHLKQRKETN